eukprot:TRINITY_DN1689_c0_g2_i1.p1 TRINITY_DN1689_c0_g2~~TRINITY_DN1689_c0_g2_i1.p1  ORF type:complete len:678 (+),score=246.40 TRINITY_DN1689_c0_g2_i1:98-2131(+)
MQRLLVLVAAVASATEVTPVQKVVELLEDIEKKGAQEKEEEKAQYEKYAKFCETTLIQKGRSISEAADKVEELDATVQQAMADIDRLTNEITAHTSDAEAALEEKQKATGIREEERGTFQTTLKDYTESIAAVGRAIQALKSGKKTSLIQLTALNSLKMLPKDALDSIDAYLSVSQPEAADSPSLLSMASAMDDAQAPQPKVYESKSGGVIKMLETLQDKFVDERMELEKEETKKKHTYELLAQRLTAQEGQAKKDKQEKAQFKAKAAQTLASAQADLEETTAEKNADQKYSNDLKATCAKKAAAFEVRQKTRADELVAVGKAKELIAGDVAGHAEKHLPSLVQSTQAASALAFLRSNMKAPASEEHVARFLQQAAKQLDSRVLSAMAARVGVDPLGKVKTLIENLIVKLNEQANTEATDKAYCDTELATNLATREDKSDSVESLQSEIDGLNAAIGKLGEESVTLTEEVGELNAAMSSATELRQKEAEKNKATIKDAVEAQKAVAKALVVLKEFYAEASDAIAFVQKSDTKVSHGQPEIFSDEPYTGMGGQSGGVVGLLEVIESDFARLEAETTDSEAAAKKEYDDFMTDSKADKAAKQTAIEHKNQRMQEDKKEVSTLQGDLAGTQKELDAALATFEALKPKCLDTGASYAQRKAQREQEIKDLEEALSELSVLQ